MTERDSRSPPGQTVPSIGEVWALAALGLILLVTAGWWALALWPVPGETPAWLSRARAVCFNATETGLPDASGWLLLIGQPSGMLAFLAVAWRRSLLGGLAVLARSHRGRAVLGVTALLVVAGLTASGVRVALAERAGAVELTAVDRLPSTYPRLDRPAPALGLVDQHGDTVTVADLRGRPTLLTFAFGECETTCPLVVANAMDARDRLPGGATAARVVVVTLDPWRDTPSRLPRLARRWDLGPGDRVLSGSVEGVQEVLDAWEIARSRDPRTGDITHPALVYVLDAAGRIAFASRGEMETLLALAGRL